jgi:hypothetical protein
MKLYGNGLLYLSGVRRNSVTYCPGARVASPSFRRGEILESEHSGRRGSKQSFEIVALGGGTGLRVIKTPWPESASELYRPSDRCL